MCASSMMQQRAGPIYPDSVVVKDTSLSNSSAISITEKSSSEDDDIPPPTQSAVSGVDGSGAPNDNSESTVIHKVVEKDAIKGPLPRVNGVREEVNIEDRAAADANNANNESSESETADGVHANNFNNNSNNNSNNNESSPDHHHVDDDVLTSNNQFLPDQDVNQVQHGEVTVRESQPPPPTKALVISGKCFIMGKKRVCKRSVSVGESEAEDAEETVVSTSSNSTDSSKGDFSADNCLISKTAQHNGNSPQIAQETSFHSENRSEMARNQYGPKFWQLALKKVPIECTDKSTLNLTECRESILVPSQSASDCPLVMTRTPQEESSTLVMVPDLILPPLFIDSISPPESKDTSAYHRFKRPVTVENPYKADLYHQPLDEGAIHSGSLQCCLKPFASVVGNMDITYSVK